MTLFGCRTTRPASLGMIPTEGFVQGWHADLRMSGGERIDRMYLREGVLFVYTQYNRVFAMTPTGGELKAIMQVAPRQGVVRPPVVLSDKWIFPTLSTFEVYTTAGKLERSADLGHATRGPATARGIISMWAWTIPPASGWRKSISPRRSAKPSGSCSRSAAFPPRPR
jgi:hypothetical protein